MSEAQEQLKRNIQTYFIQLTKGCERLGCTNPNCASNSRVEKLNQANAIKKSFDLAKENNVGNLCASYPVDVTPTNLSSTVKKNATPSKTPIQIPSLQYQELENAVEEAKSKGDYTPIVRKIGSVFGNPDAIANSFISPDPNMELNLNLDLEGLNKAYSLIESLPENVRNSFSYALERLAAELKAFAPRMKPIDVRTFLVLFQCPLLRENHTRVFGPLCAAIGNLPGNCQEVLEGYWGGFDKSLFQDLLNLFQGFITHKVGSEVYANSANFDFEISGATKALKILFDINTTKRFVSLDEFCNETVSKVIQLKDDYLNWTEEGRGFSFCNYPFILTPFYKSRMLRVESRVEQQRQRVLAVRNLMSGQDFIPVLGIKVNRENLVQDTLYALSQYSSEDLKKELRVHFVNEEAVDEGGVKKELFQLIVREIFDEKYGMFIHNKETHSYWFNPNSTDFSEFELIGKILGLAIYNSIILDIHFPKFLYKKIFNLPSNLEDIKSYDPSLYHGLKQLLDFDGDVEESFCLTFQISYKNEFSETCTYNLKNDGDQISVTNLNREEYVYLYVEYLTDNSVKKQYDAFLRGFRMLCNSPAFKLFRVDELELLVCGVSTLNFEELERVTLYDNGYNKDHPVIRNFWSVVHSMTDEQKRKLLFFSTGSDRAPIGGLQNMQFVITRHGEDSDRLPSAHTCFNHLLLPEYSSSEKLKDRLLTAISNAEGFGML
eukprot:TRINITY_DN6123_c0_g1_i1.p1 TRINITY_DN6123_c0_g1~~TRINITY_DN6123_c0_g1_i1.p1  ORF type:complete len:719 (-),score=103.52 TRINITY_DN6123_c0_g1_i1:50-2206(-)